MTRKRSRLLTFFFSLLPGAGEMYLGFLKQGASIMTLFFGSMALSSFFNFSTLLFFTPVIWFFSFFNANNLNSLPDDEFYSIEDDYVIHPSIFYQKYEFVFRKHQKLFAYGFILLGICIIWNTTFRFLYRFFREFFHLPELVLRFIQYSANSLPQLLIGILIIVVGFSLIRNKRKEIDGPV